MVSIDGSDDLNKLVGRGGEVLGRSAGTHPVGGASEDRGAGGRLMPDIARWRRRRREELWRWLTRWRGEWPKP